MGTQRENLEAGTEAKTTEEHGLLVGSSVLCSAFKIQPRSTCLGVATPTEGRALPHHSVEEMSHRSDHRPTQ